MAGGRRVTWGDLDVHYFDYGLGDSPAVSCGVAVRLGAALAARPEKARLRDAERHSPPRWLEPATRRALLREAGFSEGDIEAAEAHRRGPAAAHPVAAPAHYLEQLPWFVARSCGARSGSVQAFRDKRRAARPPGAPAPPAPPAGLGSPGAQEPSRRRPVVPARRVGSRGPHAVAAPGPHGPRLVVDGQPAGARRRRPPPRRGARLLRRQGRRRPARLVPRRPRRLGALAALARLAAAGRRRGPRRLAPLARPRRLGPLVGLGPLLRPGPLGPFARAERARPRRHGRLHPRAAPLPLRRHRGGRRSGRRAALHLTYVPPPAPRSEASIRVLVMIVLADSLCAGVLPGSWRSPLRPALRQRCPEAA